LSPRKDKLTLDQEGERGLVELPRQRGAFSKKKTA